MTFGNQNNNKEVDQLFMWNYRLFTQGKEYKKNSNAWELEENLSRRS